MRDVKSLYLEAKRTGSQHDINQYMEAVNDLMHNDPLGYISNLEYIISSSAGLHTLKEFVEENGMPLMCVDTLEACLEKCIEKCETAGKDPAEYKRVLTDVKYARTVYDESFAMFEYYKDSLPENYVETYYGKNSNGVPNKKLIAGMIGKFGEACIPDMLQVADALGESALRTAIGYIHDHYLQEKNDRILNQWVFEAAKTTHLYRVSKDDFKNVFKQLYENTLSEVIAKVDDRKNQLYRESVIMGDDSLMMEYSQNELEAIRDMITIKEYQMVATPSPKRAQVFQEEVYKLYEEFDGLIQDEQELFIEKANAKTIAAKKIASNMKSIASRVKRAITPAVNKAIHDGNYGKGLFDPRRVTTPSVQVTFGDKRGPFTFGSLGMKGKVKNNLDEIMDFSSEWIKGICIYIQLVTQTDMPVIGSASEQYWKVFIKGINNGLKDMIKDGEVSLTGNDPDNYYTTYVTTWRVPVFMSKSAVIEDVDLDFDESSQEFLEMIADSVIPMLPGDGHDIMEAQWQWNAMNKKTGDIPGYLKVNHNLGYGEDEPSKEEPKEYNLDDFRRPSAPKEDPPYSEPETPEEEPDPEKTDKPANGVNNYYYYTYNNSLNKNQGSFNRHHRDDHSVHNATTTTRDDHSTGKRVNSDDTNSHNFNSKPAASVEPEDEDENMEETLEFDFVESSNYYMDEAIYDKHVTKRWFIKSDNGVDNCCVSVKGYPNPMRGRSISIVIRKNGEDWEALIKQKPNGAWEFPGGGWDKGEKPVDSAIRELHEEAQTKIKNVKRIGTQIQFNPNKKAVSLWVRQHVANPDDWWYGYYTAIFIGEEDGKFTGHIEEEDYEDTFRWKSLKFIAKKFPRKLMDAIEKYIETEFNESINDPLDEQMSEAVDVTGKKFKKAYKAAFNYENGHMIKITYSLQGCEITNVGQSKAMRDHIASIAEEVNKENHRGTRRSKTLRSFLVALKGLVLLRKNVQARKKLITDYLNDHIGEIGYMDFQAKNCKIIEIYDLYEMKKVTEEIPVVGIFAARHMESGKSSILSEKDLKKVHEILESGKTKFHVSNHKVGDVEIWPTFMSTYWDKKSDHVIMDLNNNPIDSDAADRSTDMKLDNIPDIIADLEMKGFHVSDKEAAAYLSQYRGDKKWIPDTLRSDIKDDSKSSSKEKESEESSKKKDKEITEAVGDADDNRPESDHPVKDVLTDIDRTLVKKQQGAKKVVQDVQNVGRAFMKPVNRTSQWITNMISKWKDADENNIKEKMADPHARKNIFSAFSAAVKYGSLFKAGLILNPIFLFLSVTKGVGKHKKEFRIRNEMIGELRTEVQIIDEKIKDADRAGDNKAKYQLMRLKNEINKKLVRVGSGFSSNSLAGHKWNKTL